MSYARVIVTTLTLASITATSPLYAEEGTTGGQTAPATGGKTAATPTPEKLEEARERFQRGLQLFEEKNFEAARVELERAYEIAPTWKLLYNIGICYEQRGDYVEALKDLERYLQEGGAQIAEDRREEVNKVITNLRPRIAYVTVKTNVTDADLTLDDQPIGKVTSDPVMVNPGKRKFGVTKAGYFPAAEVVTPAGSDRIDVTITLKPLPKAEKGTDLAPIISWSVTGALAVGAGITGYLTTRADKNLDDEKNSPTATRSSLDDARSQRNTGALVTDILIAGTIIGAGLSVYFTWFRKSGAEPPASVTVGVAPGGLAAMGRF